MGNTVYTFHYNFNPFFAAWLVLVLGFIVYAIIHLIRGSRKGAPRQKVLSVLMIAIYAAIGTAAVFFVSRSLINYAAIKGKYLKEELPAVSGPVTEFHMHDSTREDSADMESFQVNGVTFAYDGGEAYGYCTRASSENAVITRDVQYVKITYFQPRSGENVICEIVLY